MIRLHTGTLDSLPLCLDNCYVALRVIRLSLNVDVLIGTDASSRARERRERVKGGRKERAKEGWRKGDGWK